MVRSYAALDIADAYSQLGADLLENGSVVDSRNGKAKRLSNVQLEIADPLKRYWVDGRHPNLAGQIYESLWVLTGQNDISMLGQYYPRAHQFSDDGKTWNGAYGPRLRNHSGHIDQWERALCELAQNENSRRAVITLADPAFDIQSVRDVPCNRELHLNVENGRLNLTVTVRSNDLVWGLTGANHFTWSLLLEVSASILDLPVGVMIYNITDLHIYERHWGNNFSGMVAAVPFVQIGTLEQFDIVANSVMRWPFNTSKQVPDLSALVLANYWEDGSEEIEPTDLRLAWENSFKRTPGWRVWLDWTLDFHQTKSALYGDSWKRHGEQGSIIPNILRKIDRLDVPGAGDSLFDTWQDLLVYLLKWKGYLQGKQVLSTPDAPALVRDTLAVDKLREFGKLLTRQGPPIERGVICELMIELVAPYAFYYWNRDIWPGLLDAAKAAQRQAQNATRQFSYEPPTNTPALDAVSGGLPLAQVLLDPRVR